MKDDQSLAYYRVLLKNPKEEMRKLIAKSSIESYNTYNDKKSEIFGGTQAKPSVKSCPFYIFSISHNIRKAEKEVTASFVEKMLALEAETG